MTDFSATKAVQIERLADVSDPAAAEALRLALAKLPEATAATIISATLAPPNVNTGESAEIWRAVDQARRTVGAVWAQLRPGGAAVVWPPQWTASVNPPHAGAQPPDPLLAALLMSLTERGVSVAQSLLPDAAAPEAAVLRAGGFEQLADLKYLTCDARQAAAIGALPPGATIPAFVPYTPADRSRLASIVERTYESTLDCPALNGLRSAAETLEEYATIGVNEGATDKPHAAHAGEAATRWWRFVRRGAIDVGCLLLADHPAYDHVELVYMGVVPEARGERLGAAIVAEALRIAAQIGRSQVVLAVDAGNRPALAMYERAGFWTWETRSAFIKRLAPPPTN